ncbi:MAG: hypothetical protein K8I27_07540 [Planctomycetes bacterium]|nr:hypothetical protein [Planctomycetota bacterium]
MDIAEAHRVLGLYVGAPREQIEARHKELTARLSTDEQSELRRLDTARGVALGEAPPEPKRGPRGWKVLLFMVVTMLLIAGSSFIGIAIIDGKRATAETERLHAEAQAIRASWDSYRKSTGISDTEYGRKGAELFTQAEAAHADGDDDTAARTYQASGAAWLEAFEAEDQRITRAWDTQVLGFWSDRLKERFPFDPVAEQDAAPQDVARLFNPASGAIWAVARDHAALADVEVQSRRLATPLKDFEQVMTQGAPIRDALFGEHSPTVDVRFELRLKAPPMLSVYRLQAGGAEATSSRGDAFVSAHWRQEEGGATLVRGGERAETEVLVDLSASDWGLLRMISKGEYTGEGDGVHSWEFAPERFGSRRGKGAAIQIRPGARNPFDLTLYAAFQPG